MCAAIGSASQLRSDISGRSLWEPARDGQWEGNSPG